MSYLGSKFPEEVNPELYREISSATEITCPHFRRAVLGVLNSNETVVRGCTGCDQKDAVILVLSAVPGETERLFVRRNSNCTQARMDSNHK